MRWLRWILLLIVLFVIPHMEVRADSSSDVTITATGIVVAQPGGFTLTYISDFEVGISWIKAPGADKTMVRAAFGHVPTDISDGYQVYYGVGNSADDTAISLGASEIVYYRAWSQTLGGEWGPLFASGDTGGFMSVSYLFIGLILIACFLTFMAWKSPNILIAFAAGLTWLSMAFWIVLGNITNLPLTSPWTQFIAWVFTIMTFVPFILQWNVEIKQTIKGQSFSTWGQPPNPGMSNYEAYKAELQRRVRTTQRRAGL